MNKYTATSGEWTDLPFIYSTGTVERKSGSLSVTFTFAQQQATIQLEPTSLFPQNISTYSFFFTSQSVLRIMLQMSQVTSCTGEVKTSPPKPYTQTGTKIVLFSTKMPNSLKKNGFASCVPSPPMF